MWLPWYQQQQQGKLLKYDLPMRSFTLRHRRVCLDIGNLKINGMFICKFFLTSGTCLWTVHIMAESIIKLHSLWPPFIPSSLTPVKFVLETLHSNNCRFNKIEVNTSASVICKLANLLMTSLVFLSKAADVCS